MQEFLPPIRGRFTQVLRVAISPLHSTAYSLVNSVLKNGQTVKTQFVFRSGDARDECMQETLR